MGYHKCDVNDNKKFYLPNKDYVKNSNKVFSNVYCLDNTSDLLFYGNFNTDMSQFL